MTSLRIRRVPRDEILELRARVLSIGDTRIAGLARDLSPRSRHWVAELEGLQVACVSVMEARGFALRGMGVLPEFQRRGVGGRMLAVVCEEVGTMWCNARVAAVPFYEKHGWVSHGPTFEMTAPGRYQRMTWLSP